MNSFVVLVVFVGTLFQGSHAQTYFPTISRDFLDYATKPIWGLTPNLAKDSKFDDANEAQWLERFGVEGEGIFEAVKHFMNKKSNVPNIVVFATLGPNGGGAIRAAKFLQAIHNSVKIYYRYDKFKDPTGTNGFTTACVMLLNDLTQAQEFTGDKTQVNVLKDDIVLDGICGPGYTEPKVKGGEPIRLAAMEILRSVNTKAFVLAVDIVSGMTKNGLFPELIVGYAPSAIIHLGFPKSYLRLEAIWKQMIAKETKHYLVFFKSIAVFPKLLLSNPTDISLTLGNRELNGWQKYYDSWFAQAEDNKNFVYITKL